MPGLPDELVEARKKSGLTQEDFIALLKEKGANISLRTYAGYERGEGALGGKKAQKVLAKARQIASEVGAQGREPAQAKNHHQKSVAISVKEDVELPDAAIVVMDLETNEVWFTIELLPRLTVHKPKRFGGRKVSRDHEAEVW